jgi:hypothetical protein
MKNRVNTFDMFLALMPFFYSFYMNVFWQKDQEIVFIILSSIFLLSQILLIYRVLKHSKYSNELSELRSEWNFEQRRIKMLNELRKK